MNALEEYRSFKSSPGFHPYLGTILADLAIAELEAELVKVEESAQAEIWAAQAERDALRDGLDDIRREVLAQLPTYSPTTKNLINKVFARRQPR